MVHKITFKGFGFSYEARELLSILLTCMHNTYDKD